MTTSDAWTWREDLQDFEFSGHFFNLDKAKKIITKRPRPVETMQVDEFAYMLIDAIIRVKAATSPKYKLDVPVIIGTLTSGRRLLLDGWHRLRKALDTKVKELPAVILTREETAEVKWKRYPYGPK